MPHRALPPPGRRRRAAALAAAWLLAMGGPLLAATAVRAEPPEETLARRYAPVVRLKEQREPCGPGEPFEPLDVRLLFGDDEVALRGPWDRTNLVAVAPLERDVSSGRHGYHLDFPGNPLAPGCDYEEWYRRLARGTRPVAYARVAGEPGRPGWLSLQYWLFYPYNDYNNKHEGDWEMIQLVFAADDAVAALDTAPVRVGYSQHEGAEQASWSDDKLERVDDTHPVVYVAAGSHANYFEPGLFLGRSAAQGVGCDDTTRPSRDVAPDVAFVPTAPAEYLARHPWLGFEGRWGEKQPAFYDGPTGPNRKPQWTHPIIWSEQRWRDRSYAVVGGSLLGPQATGVFCEAVGSGSDLLRQLTRRPPAVALALVAGIALLAWLASRMRWRPSAPLRLARRRDAGQILTASARMYLRHWPLLVRIGLIVVPVALLASVFRFVAGALADLAPGVAPHGELNTLATVVTLFFAVIFGVGVLALLQATCARVLQEIDEDRPVTARLAWRHSLRRAATMLRTLVWVAAVVSGLSLFGLGVPIAVWLAGRWILLAQAVELEDRTGVGALRRSAALVHGNWWRSVLLVATVVAVALGAGSLVGVVLLLATALPFPVVNVVASLVYAVTLPYAAIATTYLFHDLRVRQQLAAELPEEPDVLPAEI